jgi:hypothetical protein
VAQTKEEYLTWAWCLRADRAKLTSTPDQKNELQVLAFGAMRRVDESYRDYLVPSVMEHPEGRG